MSYQVLARKWRPQNFHQLVGQEHVKQALVNALEQQRLHHAYLFTGTRGVGKTTIARIFAKSLNCESGITSTPCGTCSSCQDIEAGRFIDLIEVDAASRTKVEDTREILDNVQYSPTRGRYKVYLIDEVHMLSKNSFNALLKTLEEPPEHVKFLLATTDPQKLPVTILSRCLQFNLASISVTDIAKQLAYVLGQENIAHQNDALDALAIAANGSMRDALSLTDQAIAQTNSNVTLPAVQSMLGLMDISYAKKLLSCIIANEGEALLEVIEQLNLQNGNFNAVLDDLLNLCHLILLTQLVPNAAQLDQRENEFVSEIAGTCDATQLQIYYQLLLNGKKDLTWAPSARLGFEMIMLRLLAFEPQGMADTPPQAQIAAAPSNSTVTSGNAVANKKRPSLKALLKSVKEPEKQAQDNNAPVQPVELQSDAQQAPSQPVEQPIATQQVDTPVQEQNVSTHSPEQAENQSSETQIVVNANEADLVAQYSDVMAEAEQLQQESASMMTHAGIAQQSNMGEGNIESNRVENSEVTLEGKSIAPHPEPHDQQCAQYAEQGAHLAEQAAHQAPITNDLASQGDEPMQADVHNEPTPQPESPVDLAAALDQQMAGAESAIASILKRRNISGTGVLNNNSEQQPKKAEPQPQGAPIGKKESPLEKYKGEQDNVAPELIAQLQPVEQPKAVEEVIEPLPVGFESPISDIKYAHQQDDWAKMIEDMQLGGRIRQFALHSRYTREQGQVILHVDQQQQHLDSQVMRDSLTQALSTLLAEAIELVIEFVGEIDNTPYLIQQQIDQYRLQQAIHTIKHDELVVQMVTRFDANIDESSILAL